MECLLLTCCSPSAVAFRLGVTIAFSALYGVRPDDSDIDVKEAWLGPLDVNPAESIVFSRDETKSTVCWRE